MKDRPAVFIRLEAEDENFGWGEVFANWPASGAEHRARLLIEDISELLWNLPISAPSDLFHWLNQKTHVRSLQCGEWGPFRQVIAGLDIAVHDMFARRHGVSVSQFLNDTAPSRIPYYASGLHIRTAENAISAARKEGARAYKVKVGFGTSDELDRVIRLAADISDEEILLTDANQAWNFEQAAGFLRGIAGSKIGWLEEPIGADRPSNEWSQLAEQSEIPLAGGENLAGFAEFDAAIESGALSVFQPDIAKWGGFTGCLSVAKRAMASGSRYCPHFLGGGIGLLASAHLLAAAGGDGMLEIDANPNPLRDTLATYSDHAFDGYWNLEDKPGLGIEKLPREIAPMLTYSAEARG